MIKPSKLKKGDKVAVVSLSSGILGEDFVKHQVELGIKRLKDLGLEVVFMPHTKKGMDFIKHNPKYRAEDLKQAFKDDSIKAIICAIGGDDTYKIIPYLMEDLEFKKLVVNKPKIFIGFSDSTNNHLMLYKLGLVTYYGLNFLSDLCELSKDMLKVTKESYELFFKNEENYEIKSSNSWFMNREKYDIDELNKPLIEQKETHGYEVLYGSGKINGKFYGGCLESLYDIYTSERYSDQRAIYNKYNLISDLNFFKDKIIFIETSEEKLNPKKFELILNYFIEEKILLNIRALIVGKPYDEVYYDEYKDILVKLANQYKIPVIYNVNVGHALPRVVIPYGLEGMIDFDQKRIFVTEKLFKD